MGRGIGQSRSLGALSWKNMGLGSDRKVSSGYYDKEEREVGLRQRTACGKSGTGRRVEEPSLVLAPFLRTDHCLLLMVGFASL